MEKKLLVLYSSEKLGKSQTYCIYGDANEADDELKLMQEHDGTLKEKGRIEITKTAKVAWLDY